MKYKKLFKSVFLITALILLSGAILSACAPERDAKHEPIPPGTTPDTNPPTEHVNPEDPEDPPDERERFRVSIVNGEFKVDNGTKTLWINGVNIPWHRWNDFDRNFDAGWWDGHFAELRAIGVNSARLWINCNNDNNVIIIDTDGLVSGVTDDHWEALDQLFNIAEHHGIYLMPTFLSFDHFKSRNADGWRNMVKSDVTVDSYIEHFTLPFLARYKDNPFLWSIDLMNEPDWVHEGSENGQLAWEDISRFFARNAAAIRENSSVLVTVGIAFPKYNADGAGYEGNKVSDEFLQSIYPNKNAKLDFWSTHYYDWVGQWYGIPFTSSPHGPRSEGGWGLCASKPAVLAEHSGNGSEGFTLTEDYLNLFNNGWHGAMTWSSNNNGTGDKMGGIANIGPATMTIAELHPELVFPLG